MRFSEDKKDENKTVNSKHPIVFFKILLFKQFLIFRLITTCD